MSWICPKCERELKALNQIHYCAKVSIDSLFAGKDQELILVFDKILAEVAGWEGVLVSTTPHCIVFVHRYTFLIIRPMKKVLDVKFYSEAMLHGSLIIKSTGREGKFENHVIVKTSDDLTMQLFGYLKRSWELL
jgi:Domain of unknown function (DUF5655)